MVIAHMRAKATTGLYKKNWVLGFTGATGFVQGVHTHIEGWYAPMDRAKLNKGNWNQLTFDIMLKIKK